MSISKICHYVFFALQSAKPVNLFLHHLYGIRDSSSCIFQPVILNLQHTENNVQILPLNKKVTNKVWGKKKCRQEICISNMGFLNSSTYKFAGEREGEWDSLCIVSQFRFIVNVSQEKLNICYLYVMYHRIHLCNQ